MAKLVIQMRRLRVRDIKKFVQVLSVDLEPELCSSSSQNEVYYINPLRNLYPGETQLVQRGRSLALKPVDLSKKMAALLKAFSACNSVAICTGFKTQGTRLEGEVATQPVRHSVGWERRREGNLDIAKETLALVEGQPLRRVIRP